jgi:hypothetical protein
MDQGGNGPNYRRDLRSIGTISCAPHLPDAQKLRGCGLLPVWHGPCKHRDNPSNRRASSSPPNSLSTQFVINPIRHQQGTTLMKTFAFLAAAFALSFALMAATVIVPVGTTSFIA